MIKYQQTIIGDIIKIVGSQKDIKSFTILDDKLLIQLKYELFYRDIEMINDSLKKYKVDNKINLGNFYIHEKNIWDIIILDLKIK